MSVPDSNQDKSAANGISGPRLVTGGDHAAQTAAADDNARLSTDNKCRREMGGPEGPEPTRYGDWERKGRCIDF